MFEYITTDKFDIGEGYGELEYDFFMINDKKDFWALINHYGFICKRFNYFVEGYDVAENNEVLSPIVQVKMKEHNANISLTFLEEKYIEKNIKGRRMVVNEKKPDGKFDTYHFYFFSFVEKR